MLRNCSRCFALFIHEESRLCAACARKSAETHAKLRALLRENPQLSAVELKRTPGVPPGDVLSIVPRERPLPERPRKRPVGYVRHRGAYRAARNRRRRYGL